MPVLGSLGQLSGSALGMAAHSTPKNGAHSPPPYGMSMWFDVRISGTQGGKDDSLGAWAGCSGLGVDFHYLEHGFGGTYEGTKYLTTRMEYGKVTLERAMLPAHSQSLQRWLEEVAAQWMRPTSHQKPYTGRDVTIDLRSGPATGDKVRTWTLRNAIPVRWSGPTLMHDGAGLAMERLTLVHDGFLKEPPLAQSFIKLSCKDDHNNVTFPRNPENVTYEKLKLIDRLQLLEQQVIDPGAVSITMDDLLVTGAGNILSEIPKLWGWMEPPPAGGGRGKEQKDLKELALQVGSGNDALDKTVVLKGLTVRYSRFTDDGVPVSAWVTLVLQVQPWKSARPGAAGPQRNPLGKRGRP